MNDPQDQDERLGAYLDAELTAEAASQVEQELKASAELRQRRDELLETMAALHETFEETLREAPPAPAALPFASTNGALTRATPPEGSPPRSQSPMRSRVSSRSLLAAAALVILGTGAFLWQHAASDSEARALLTRVAAKYVDLPALEAVIRPLDSPRGVFHGLFQDAPGGTQEALVVHLRLAGSHRYVIQESNDASLWSTTADLLGNDGETLWRYRPSSGNVLSMPLAAVEPAQQMWLEKGRAVPIQDIDILRFLSYDFLRALEALTRAYETESYEVEEVKSWRTQRGLRQILKIRPGPGWDGSTEALRWTEAELEIDPENDVIDRMTIELQVRGGPRVRFEIGVQAHEQGLAQAEFRYESYVTLESGEQPAGSAEMLRVLENLGYAEERGVGDEAAQRLDELGYVHDRPELSGEVLRSLLALGYVFDEESAAPLLRQLAEMGYVFDEEEEELQRLRSLGYTPGNAD